MDRQYTMITMYENMSVPCETVRFEGFELLRESASTLTLVPKFKDWASGLFPHWVEVLFKNNVLTIERTGDNTDSFYLCFHNNCDIFNVDRNSVLVRYKSIYGPVNYTVLPLDVYKSKWRGVTSMEEF